MFLRYILSYSIFNADAVKCNKLVDLEALFLADVLTLMKENIWSICSQI